MAEKRCDWEWPGEWKVGDDADHSNWAEDTDDAFGQRGWVVSVVTELCYFHLSVYLQNENI